MFHLLTYYLAKRLKTLTGLYFWRNVLQIIAGGIEQEERWRAGQSHPGFEFAGAIVMQGS
jgi:hypothetical protein